MKVLYLIFSTFVPTLLIFNLYIIEPRKTLIASLAVSGATTRLFLLLED